MPIVIPCAGASTRYPTRPKYLLTLYNGKLMAEMVVDSYPDEELHFIILKAHVEEYDAEDSLNRCFDGRPNVHIHILDELTTGPAETVYSILHELDPNDNLFIKDCDSFFTSPLRRGNYISAVNLKKYRQMANVADKSFVVTDHDDIVVNIIEKDVCSNYVSVGGYSFETIKLFSHAYENVSSAVNSEIFISHLIKYLLKENVFTMVEVDDYVDCGTYSEFLKVNRSKPTIFCDLDGTLFKNQSKYFKNSYENPPTIIKPALNFLLKHQNEGSLIIFTTSRPEKYRDITETALKDCGFKNYRIILDIPHSPRILINDYASSNPYPTATAINVERDNFKIL